MIISPRRAKKLSGKATKPFDTDKKEAMLRTIETELVRLEREAQERAPFVKFHQRLASLEAAYEALDETQLHEELVKAHPENVKRVKELLQRLREKKNADKAEGLRVRRAKLIHNQKMRVQKMLDAARSSEKNAEAESGSLFKAVKEELNRILTEDSELLERLRVLRRDPRTTEQQRSILMLSLRDLSARAKDFDLSRTK